MSRPHLFDTKPRGDLSPFAQPRYLTEAVAVAVHARRGTVKCVADAIGVKPLQVYRVADINDPRPLPAAWIPAICQETGSFAILDALEARVGRIAYQLPAAAGEGRERARAHLVAAFSAVLGADATEDAQLPDAIDALLRRTCEYRALVHALADADPMPTRRAA